MGEKPKDAEGDAEMEQAEAQAQIGRTLEETQDLDWQHWYPVVSRGTGRIVDVLPASLDTIQEQEQAARYTFDEHADHYWAE